MSERSELPSLLRDLLGSTAARAGIDDPLSTGAVWARWGEIVGPELARHAEPTSLKSGVLRIRTESPVWATELGYLGPEIKQQVNAVLGREVVTEVSVWTGPGPVGRRDRPAPDRSTEPSVTTRTSEVKDPVSAFENARRAWAERRSKRGL